MKKKNIAKLCIDESANSYANKVRMRAGPYPHSHKAAKLTTTLRTSAAKEPLPMKSSGKHLLALAAMFTTPATVKALGPIETNIPGRTFSLGSFCDISLYIKAEYTINDTRKPTP
jgi:hypothetical protein